jgi:hypothetical protein
MASGGKPPPHLDQEQGDATTRRQRRADARAAKKEAEEAEVNPFARSGLQRTPPVVAAKDRQASGAQLGDAEPNAARVRPSGVVSPQHERASPTGLLLQGLGAPGLLNPRAANRLAPTPTKATRVTRGEDAPGQAQTGVQARGRRPPQPHPFRIPEEEEEGGRDDQRGGRSGPGQRATRGGSSSRGSSTTCGSSRSSCSSTSTTGAAGATRSTSSAAWATSPTACARPTTSSGSSPGRDGGPTGEGPDLRVRHGH